MGIELKGLSIATSLVNKVQCKPKVNEGNKVHVIILCGEIFSSAYMRKLVCVSISSYR